MKAKMIIGKVMTVIGLMILLMAFFYAGKITLVDGMILFGSFGVTVTGYLISEKAEDEIEKERRRNWFEGEEL